MSNYTNAVFVGEPTAENINFYGDNRPVQLPNSKLTAYLSFAWWQDKPQWENGPWLAPHIAVEMNFEEYKNNEDPVLEAALNFKGETFHLNPMEYITELFTTGQIDKLQSEAIRMVQDPRYAFFDFEGKLNEAGDNLLKSQRVQESIFALTLTSQLFPKSAITQLNLGTAYKKAGDPTKARECLQNAAALDQEGKIGKMAERMIGEME
jgi:tetratricopeptide (TPR) repeat protein